MLERYDRLKRRRGALDFNDLEARRGSGARRTQHVREVFQKRFDLVLVDEFQDTNPLQARIIWRFVRPDRSNLCVVGDPKQSIYRFRDADVSGLRGVLSRAPRAEDADLEFSQSRPASSITPTASVRRLSKPPSCGMMRSCPSAKRIRAAIRWSDWTCERPRELAALDSWPKWSAGFRFRRWRCSCARSAATRSGSRR